MNLGYIHAKDPTESITLSIIKINKTSRFLVKGGVAMKATARANTNIALIKYWGKRDETLFLPMNSSLSITLDKFYTTTTVQFCKDLPSDIFLLNGCLAGETDTLKISVFLDRFRKMVGENLKAIVTSINKVPTAAGLASSASGFAALAAAAAKALRLNLDKQELSVLARQGSGSASRSIYGGFVEWQKGIKEDGTDSFAKPILSEQEWPLSVLSVLVESDQKIISSREGMKRTVETSPFYPGWLDTVDQDLTIAKEAIKLRNFEMLGKIVEANALKMHATMFGATPPIIYWKSGTLEVMQRIQKLRLEGIQVYFTIDAGPNVKVLCLPEDEQRVYETLKILPEVQHVFVCHPGSGIIYFPDTRESKC
jgi:diphosphomevalonate decarboxylase